MAIRFPSLLAFLSWLLAVASLATAAPVGPPDLTSCQPPDLPASVAFLNCCIPYSANVIDFVPPRPATLRVRRRAHKLHDKDIQRYRIAVGLMKNLSSTDPRSFGQQAIVHCAFCNGAYNQTGYQVEYQVHNSWLFFPFHRAYLYFYERILGKLLNDSTFALPFWNWDDPGGMRMPKAFTRDPTSALYDPRRDPFHQPPVTMDLNFNGTDNNSTKKADQIRYNLGTMYRQMVTGSQTAALFFGSPLRAGDPPNPGPGTIESVPHNPIHFWTGDHRQPNYEDMGAFYSAGRDPIFFAHHANVDRMWSLWTRLSTNNTVFNDTDWLDSSFLFWDENTQLVRVRVRDLVDTRALGYVYENVKLRWLNSTLIRRDSRARKPRPTPGLRFPVHLTTPVSVQLSRPTGSRVGQEEVLVVQNITVNDGVYSKFDVYINAGANQSVTPQSVNYAGSFVHVAMGSGTQVMNVQELQLGLSVIFTNLGIGANVTSVVATLVPGTPRSNIRIGGLAIQLVASTPGV